jgi:nitrite reductase (NADH) small subunit
VADIPPMGARVVRSANGDIAVFRTADDQVFALYDRCPHKGGPLSEGIVHGRSVTCPLHNWVISLESGAVEGPDQGCAAQIAVSVDQGRIRLALPRPARAAHG